MKLGGYRTLSTVDYPGKVVATIFTAGCNFHCEYCHNYDLINESECRESVEFSDILSHLEKRKFLLDGVCISGGEPLLHFQNVKTMILKLKAEFPHFLIKVDTNGSSLEKIQNIAKYVDFIAIDFKGLEFKQYSNQAVDIQGIIKYLNLSEIEYEIRLTLYPDYFPIKDFEKVSEMVKMAKVVAIQNYSAEHVRERKNPYDMDVLDSFKEILEKKISKVIKRY